MSGTEWTEPGKGATLTQLDEAIQAQDGTPEQLDPRQSERAMFLAVDENLMLFVPTNLRLTGAPLIPEDLKRIATCEVTK